MARRRSSKPPSMREIPLQAALLLAAPRELPHMRLFRRNVGVAHHEGRVVTYALPGQCDLYALVQGGRHLEIELKSADGVMKPDQVVWMVWCNAWSIPHVVLSPERGESVEQTIARWCLAISRMS